MVAYLTDSESHSSSSLEIEKAWHLVSVLLRLGRPSRPAELAARCLLFHGSPDLIQFLCSIPGSPLFLTEDQFVMISLEVLLSGFSEFASKAISFCVPKISARVSWPKRSWDGSVQTYFRKRKGVRFASFLLPTAKRRLLSLNENEEKEHRTHSLPNAIQSFSSKENSNAGDDMGIDMGSLPFNTSVEEHALAISGQENVMPHLLPTPGSVLSIYRLEDVDNKGATETETRCNVMGSSISFRESPDDTCFVECRHSFPSTEIDLNKNIMINENLKANELDGELTLFTVAMHESICVPHDTGTFRGNPESCVPLDKTAQIGEVIEAKVTIGNQIKCADKMISSFTDQKADEVEIPVSSLPAEPSSAQRLPMNSFSKQKPLHGNDLAPGLEVLSNPLDENKLFSPSKQRELDKNSEKGIFKKQKSKRCHNNHAPAKEHRADPMSKSNKIFSELKPLPDFESFFVEEEEGSGGYGTVYRARRRNDGKTFAVKCPHANAHAHHVNNELKMLERFGGRNFVIKFEGSFKSGNSDCFVLEHVEHDRPEVLKREIDASELQWYGYCLFRALASLHKQGIVHRDVKPGNFLFSRKRCKGYLIDFNLAMDLNQKYCTNSKPKMNNNGSFDHVPRPDASTKEAMKVAYSGTVKSVSRKVSRDSPHETNNVNKRVDAGHFKTNDLGSRIKFRSQGAEVSGVTSAKDVTSTRTPSAERLKEPMPCHGRKALINFVQEALQGPKHEAVSSRSPASQRKRVAAAPGKPEKTLVYLSPMPLHSSGIAVAGGGLLNGRGDRKHKREGPCVGTKGFRAPEVLFKSAHQGPKVDVWSAGVTLLYLMTGRTPFVGDPEQNIKDIAKLRGSEDVWELAKLHSRESSFPADLFDVRSLPSTDLRGWCELNTRRPDFNEMAPWSLFDLVDKCLTVNPRVRISADEALCHEFFAPCHEALRKQRLLKRSLGSESRSQSCEAKEP